MKGLIALVLLCLGTAAVCADDEAPLTLADAQTEARTHAPDADALDIRVAGIEAIARDKRRRLRTDPELSTSYASGAAGGDAGEQSVGLGLAWTLDLSGAWRDARDAADADRDRAGASRDDGLAALDEAVALAVADLAHAQRQLERAEKIVGLQQTTRDAAVRLLDSLQGTQLDVDAAELDLAAASADREEARADRERAQIALARLLGREEHAALVVADPIDDAGAPSESDLDAMVDDDPRVRAADAAARSAKFEQQAADRSTWKSITFGLDVDYARHDIPEGSFAGDGTLGAAWQDWEIGVRVSVPLPLFDRRHESRTRARAQVSDVVADAAVVRADVLAELKTAAAELRGAVEVWKALAATGETIDREYDLLDKAFRAGALDVDARAQSAKRLVDAGARLDAALRDLRVARARWIRRTTR